MALNVCVLRRGGEYRPEHVRALAQKIPKLVCISDVAIPGVQTITMLHDWPGWWCKMELFRPDIYGDLFYLDLDTVVVGDIERLAAAGRTTMLSDFYFPGRAASGLMYLSAADREAVWHEWIKDPAGHMARCGNLGDQKLIGDCLPNAARWQDEFPGDVISYKVHVCSRLQSSRGQGDGRLPAGAKLVCFHGQPRPWSIKADWVPSYG